jgi:hypothetical protein
LVEFFVVALLQVSLVRRMMHTIYDSRAPGMNPGFFGGEPDLKKEWAQQWDVFYRESFFFKYFLDYSATLTQLSDMSFLWYGSVLGRCIPRSCS